MNLTPARLALHCCLWLWLCAVPLRAEPTELESVEKSAGDWLKVRAETARLETDWNSQRQLLDSIVHGLEERAQALEARRDYLQVKTTRDREDLASLEAANRAAAARLDSVGEQLKLIAPRLLQLRVSLPSRLSEALTLPYKSLAAPELSMSERMQATMTVLNRCNQFNRSITCDEELLVTGAEKTPQLLEVIYWGLSHGYALDRAKGRAWYGTSGSAGWQWEPMNDGVKPVGALIAIYHSKGEPVFTEVPARLKNTAAASAKN